jgi:hypothetical protein
MMEHGRGRADAGRPWQPEGREAARIAALDAGGQRWSSPVLLGGGDRPGPARRCRSAWTC